MPDAGGEANLSLEAPVSVEWAHRVRFTQDVFDPANPTLRDVLATGEDSSGRTAVFVDEGVRAAWPDLAERITAYAGAHPGLFTVRAPIHAVPGGEQAKNDAAVWRRVAAAIDDAGICRHSYVFAIGGGAVLDAVGFAASIAHRGVRLLRFPTTTLAQDDAGIGVKTGINAFGKKNFLGTFAVPWAVINDTRFLATLGDRDWRAGFAEAVKVALLKDAALFHRIADAAPRLARRDEEAALPVLQRSAELHFDHIVRGGDPFEWRNARPLDFGHWAAHKLEQLSGFRIRHGEAVAIGIALDVTYSVLMGMLSEAEADSIHACLNGLGLALYDCLLSRHAEMLDGLDEFREHLGGRLAITLLEGIGRPVDAHEIEDDRMIEAMDRLRTCAAVPPAEGRRPA